MLSYIPDDGYTEPGYIAEIPRLHGALRFKFRPMRVEAQSRLLQSIRPPVKDDAANVKSAEVFAKQITEWDLVDRDGAKVLHTSQAILNLKPALFFRLSQILLGNDASDVDPDEPEHEPESTNQLLENDRGN